MNGIIRIATLWLAAVLVLAGSPGHAQTFPPLSGRVVDAANILSPATEAALTAKLASLEAQSQRQVVVATIADLGGNDVADYGYRLGRAWGIGGKDRNDGVILLIAPNDHRVTIQVGYGLEPVLTDALSARIIRDVITPRFKAGDFDGGVTAGVDAIATQLTLPPDQAAAVVHQASQPQRHRSGGGFPVIFGLFWFGFIVLLIFGRRNRGRQYGNEGSGIGSVLLWGAAEALSHRNGGGSSWGDSSSSWGGGDSGGFSGGGGSFGGGGASGGW